MPGLTREQIVGICDWEIELIEVPEWNGSVYVRSVPSRVRSLFEAESVAGDKSNLKTLRERIVSQALCDEQGARLFDDTQVSQLGEKSAKVIDRLFDIAIMKAGIDPDEKTKGLEGKLKAITAGDSPTD